MPLTSTWPAAVDVFPRPTSGVSLQSNPNEADLVNVHSDAIQNLQGVVGATGVLGTHAARISSLEAGGTQVIDVRDMNLTEGAGADAATNTFNFVFYGTAAPAIFYFGPGQWNNISLTITHSDQHIIGHSTGSTTLYYKGSAAAPNNACVVFVGPADDTQAGRIYHNGVRDVTIANHGSQSNNNAIGLKLRNVTHLRVDRVAFGTWRGSAIEASNFADSSFTWCEFDYCGSGNDADLAVVTFNGTQTSWAVDQVKFAFCRWENCGDRIFDFRQGNGHLVNKIQCIQCKFENSVNTGNGIGGSAGNGAQFYFDTCHWVTFVQCEFTLQQFRDGSHTIIPTCFRMVGETFLSLTDCWFNFGSGDRPKIFTNFFLLGSSTTAVLTLHNVWLNNSASNGTPYPTDVINTVAAGSPFPVVVSTGCGYTPLRGSALELGDWINGSYRGPEIQFKNGVTA